MSDTYTMFFPWPTNDVDAKLLRSMEEQCRTAARGKGHTTIGKATFVGINRLSDGVYPFEYEFSVRLKETSVEGA